MAPEEGVAVNIVRPDSDNTGDSHKSRSVTVRRIESDRGYFHTYVNAAQDQNREVHLYERSVAGEELLAIDIDIDAVRVDTGTELGFVSVRELAPDNSILASISINRDEARELGNDLIHFADTGRLPGPK